MKNKRLLIINFLSGIIESFHYDEMIESEEIFSQYLLIYKIKFIKNDPVESVWFRDEMGNEQIGVDEKIIDLDIEISLIDEDGNEQLTAKEKEDIICSLKKGL